MEMEPSKLFLAQNYITEMARKHGKPIVMATQMLESMTSNSRPTRAEITDVGVSVWNQNDATMLSGETGNGKFPVESVKLMSDICRETEFHLDYEGNYRKFPKYNKKACALARGAVEMSFTARSKVIMVTSQNPEIVSQISALRPEAIIMYVHDKADELRGLNLSFGVFGVLTKSEQLQNFKNVLSLAEERLRMLDIENPLQKAVYIDGDNSQIKLMD